MNQVPWDVEQRGDLNGVVVIGLQVRDDLGDIEAGAEQRGATPGGAVAKPDQRMPVCAQPLFDQPSRETVGRLASLTSPNTKFLQGCLRQAKRTLPGRR
jgi:hypothetical protein